MVSRVDMWLIISMGSTSISIEATLLYSTL